MCMPLHNITTKQNTQKLMKLCFKISPYFEFKCSLNSKILNLLRTAAWKRSYSCTIFSVVCSCPGLVQFFELSLIA